MVLSYFLIASDFDVFAIVVFRQLEAAGIVCLANEVRGIAVEVQVRHHDVGHAWLLELVNSELRGFVEIGRLLDQHLLDFRVACQELRLFDIVTAFFLDHFWFFRNFFEWTAIIGLKLHWLHLVLHVFELFYLALIEGHVRLRLSFCRGSTIYFAHFAVNDIVLNQCCSHSLVDVRLV
jgi:hypothetical protein